ncbi:MAG TPA: EamA family transporter [Chitinophagaceae bacterium]|nr:EamA family transporter [Chitinophagaceae bacterium]
MSRKELNRAYIALGLVSFFWGTTFIAARIGAQYMPGLFLSAVRQFSSGLLMVSFFLLKGYKLPDWKSLKQITIQGIFLLSLANGLLTWAMEYINSGFASIISATVPLFVTLFSVWLLRNAKLTVWMLVGMVIGFAGVVIIFYDYLHQLEGKSVAFGIVLSFLGVLAWTFGTVYASKQKPPVDILFSVGLQMLIAGTITLISCFATGKYINISEAGNKAWYALLYLIFFGSVLAYSAYVFAISKLPPAFVSIYAYINPIVAVFFGWLLLHEEVNSGMLLGSIVTLGGVFMVNREYKKQRG